MMCNARAVAGQIDDDDDGDDDDDDDGGGGEIRDKTTHQQIFSLESIEMTGHVPRAGLVAKVV
jgi:hypothetical protein